MRRILPAAVLVATCALVAWIWWPLATELLQTGIPADMDDHRVSHHVLLTGFILLSAVFISVGMKNIGKQDGEH
ncbi:MAG TPA: hypothetical protein VFG28_14285 [Syntrophales bacterium]|nr:hypothetical protein [Syntrophales bacterium]